MSWRTYLLLTAVSSCFSFVQLSGTIYILTKGKDPEFKFHVCCFYNGSVPNNSDIRLRVENRTVETVHDDDFTISYRVYRDQLGPMGLEFRCIFPDNSSTKAIISRSTLLRATQLKCTYIDHSAKITCNFIIYEYLNTSGIFLTINNTIKGDCTNSHKMPKFYSCNLQYPINFHGIDQNFTIVLNSEGILRKHSFQLTNVQMRVPYWPTNQPHIKMSKDGVCIDFGMFAFKNSNSYEWRVTLFSISNGEREIISYLNGKFKESEGVCFKKPQFSHKFYNVTLWVRFNNSFAPWITDNYNLSFFLGGSKPDELPTFYQNGYYYDPEKKELHVFWEQLAEIYFNGPNFTYIVTTDTGKEPSLTGNCSAVFHGWNPQQTVTVFIRAQNSFGRFEKSNSLDVPALTKYERRQPRNLKYHLEDRALTWDPPQEEKNLSGYLIYSCFASTNINHICESNEQLKRNGRRSRWEKSYQFDNASLKMAVLAEYTDSYGGMTWYGVDLESSKTLEQEPNSLEIGLIITVVTVVLTSLIFVLFQKWKQKKIKEIVVTLPPIFDPIVMDRLRLRNVNFSYCHEPPVKTTSSARAPWKIFLGSKETTKIVAQNTAQLRLRPDASDPAISPYTIMNTNPLNGSPDNTDSISQPDPTMDTMARPKSFIYS